MRKIILIVILPCIIHAQDSNPVQTIFIQSNNINTCCRSDGISNLDRTTYPNSDAGFIWPVNSTSRKTMVYMSGIFIGAKVGPQHELRLAASAYSSHFTPGYIPIVGQVPPQSVCNDTNWRLYLVSLTDESLLNGGIRFKTAGGRVYTFKYDSWANWPVQKGAPYIEVNNIPGYQPGWNSDRPGIGNGSKARPDDLCFTVFMDYTNCTNNIHHSEISLPGGTLPLGVEIQQIIYMFNCPSLKDMYFVKWRVINKSLYSWDSTFFAMYNDVDMGNESCSYHNDKSGCDTLKNLGNAYKKNNYDCVYGLNPPAIGYRYLQSPLKFTGNSIDTAKLPYDTLIGYKLTGLTSYFLFINSHWDPCLQDPDEAWGAYNYMRGKDKCGRDLINPITQQPTNFMFPGDACSQTGWYDTNLVNIRDISSAGPFEMNVSDTQIVTVAFVVGYGSNNFQNVCIMKNYSDTALKYYYNDFRTCIPIGIQPISNEVPERFELFQNYPNPFNPVTKVKFSLPTPSEGGVQRVELLVYDILGREIINLINEELKPGIYEIEWNAENYPSGVYFYTLTAGNYFDSKKMILLK